MELSTNLMSTNQKINSSFHDFFNNFEIDIRDTFTGSICDNNQSERSIHGFWKTL